MKPAQKPFLKYWPLLLLIGICVTCTFGNTKTDTNKKNRFWTENTQNTTTENTTNIEAFEDFFFDFCYEEDFQKSRIEFPLVFVSLNFDLTDFDTLFLKKDDWKYFNLGFGEDVFYFYQFYNNFEREFADTDERLFTLRGINTGEKTHYYFKRKMGLWYLIKVEDLST